MIFHPNIRIFTLKIKKKTQVWQAIHESRSLRYARPQGGQYVDISHK